MVVEALSKTREEGKRKELSKGSRKLRGRKVKGNKELK